MPRLASIAVSALLLLLCDWNLMANAQKAPTGGEIAFSDGRKVRFKLATGLREQRSQGTMLTTTGKVNFDVKLFEPVPGQLVFWVGPGDAPSEIRVSIDKIAKLEFVRPKEEKSFRGIVKLTYDNGKESEFAMSYASHAIDVTLDDGVITHRYAIDQLRGATISFSR